MFIRDDGALTARSETGPATTEGGCSFHLSSGSCLFPAAPSAGAYFHTAMCPELVPPASSSGVEQGRQCNKEDNATRKTM